MGVTMGVVTAMPLMVLGMATRNNQGPMPTMAEEVASPVSTMAEKLPSPVSTVAEKVASPVSTVAEEVASPVSTMARLRKNLGGSQFRNQSGRTAKK